MRIIAIVSALLLVIVPPQIGHAHFDHDDSLVLLLNAAQDDPRAPGERTLVGLHIVNQTNSAATLRGFRLEGHGPIEFQKLRDLYIVKSWQPVQFLRVDVGENLTLSPARFRIPIPTRVWRSKAYTIYADFGPLGEIEVHNLISYQGSDDAVREK